jgi:hypothetical protein
MMSQVYDIYHQFLSIFPDKFHWVVSLALAAMLVYAIFQTLKRNFIWIILLVILLPASVPILKGVWQSVVDLIQFLITKK